MIPSSACQPWHADHPGPCRRARRPKPSATPRHGTRSYHRLVWTITPLAIDPVNRDYLIEKCPDCGRLLTWWRMAHPARCDRCAKKLWLCIDSVDSRAPTQHDTIIADLFHPNPRVRQSARGRLPPNVRTRTEGEILDFLGGGNSAQVVHSPRPFYGIRFLCYFGHRGKGTGTNGSENHRRDYDRPRPHRV